jgi:hypothetical protein
MLKRLNSGEMMPIQKDRSVCGITLYFANNNNNVFEQNTIYEQKFIIDEPQKKKSDGLEVKYAHFA